MTQCPNQGNAMRGWCPPPQISNPRRWAPGRMRPKTVRRIHRILQVISHLFRTLTVQAGGQLQLGTKHGERIVVRIKPGIFGAGPGSQAIEANFQEGHRLLFRVVKDKCVVRRIAARYAARLESAGLCFEQTADLFIRKKSAVFVDHPGGEAHAWPDQPFPRNGVRDGNGPDDNVSIGKIEFGQRHAYYRPTGRKHPEIRPDHLLEWKFQGFCIFHASARTSV